MNKEISTKYCPRCMSISDRCAICVAEMKELTINLQQNNWKRGEGSG